MLERRNFRLLVHVAIFAVLTSSAVGYAQGQDSGALDARVRELTDRNDDGILTAIDEIVPVLDSISSSVGVVRSRVTSEEWEQVAEHDLDRDDNISVTDLVNYVTTVSRLIDAFQRKVLGLFFHSDINQDRDLSLGEEILTKLIKMTIAVGSRRSNVDAEKWGCLQDVDITRDNRIDIGDLVNYSSTIFTIYRELRGGTIDRKTAYNEIAEALWALRDAVGTYRNRVTLGEWAAVAHFDINCDSGVDITDLVNFHTKAYRFTQAVISSP